MPTFFISHSWDQAGHHFAMRLASALRASGIDVWIDEEQIFRSPFLTEAIIRGIKRESNGFLYVISPAALESRMCQVELNLAFEQMEEYGKPIIPILLERCAIPEALMDLPYIDFDKPQYFEASVGRLVETIKSVGEIQRKCSDLFDPIPERRAAAAQDLTDCPHLLAFGPLKKRLLEQEADPIVQHWLAAAIGEFQDLKSLSLLIRAIRRLSDPYALLGVSKAINSLDRVLRNQAIEDLSNMAKSDAPAIRLRVLSILSHLALDAASEEPTP